MIEFATGKCIHYTVYVIAPYTVHMKSEKARLFNMS